MSERPELMTFQQGEELKERFDRLLGLLGEEINIHPDTVYPTIRSYALEIGTNSAVLPMVSWEVLDRESGRWLVLRIRGAEGYELLRREWKCVYRDPTGLGFPVVDRPGKWRQP
jgi:hypothetical protein